MRQADPPSSERARATWPAWSPLVWVLCGVFLLHAIGIAWGLPAADGWDNDGVAPRDFLVGIVRTFTPGDYYTYPPLHVLILTILTSPLWIVGLLHARSLAPSNLVHEFLNVPYMTAFALIARAVSVAMSLGVVYALAKVGEELRGRRAGVAVAVVVGMNAPFAYYAHTSNLEVPYCFWAAFALLHFVRALAQRRPKELRWAGALAALSIATKDQAAALFVLGFPLGMALWVAIDPWPRVNARAVSKEAAGAAAWALGIVIALDGAIVNPSGFRARLGFLFGSASQDYMMYAKTFAGRIHALRDAVLSFTRFYPAPFALLALWGVVVSARAGSRGQRAAALAPLFLAISFFALFNWFTLRSDERFFLPQMLLFGVYAGLGLDALLFETTRRVARAMQFAAIPVLAWGLFECAAVDVALIDDARYDAEAWLAGHVQPGDGLEVYGNQIYLPRLPANARIDRVDQKPLFERNPLLGATEIVGRFEDVEERRPRWIVVTDSQVGAYLDDPKLVERAGRVLPPGQMAAQRDAGAQSYFRELLAGRRGYALAHVSEWKSTIWPRIDFHGSTAQRVHILEREASP